MTYQVTRWAGGYHLIGAFDTFAGALVCFAGVTDRTKQLVNVDRADSGRDGLTDEERDQVAEVAYSEELASERVAKVKDGWAQARSDAALHAHDTMMARKAVAR